MVYRVSELSDEQRRTVEGLLGRPVTENERVSVRAVADSGGGSEALSAQQRRELLDRVRKYFAEVDARREAVSESDEEDALDEAIRSVRPQFRPVR